MNHVHYKTLFGKQELQESIQKSLHQLIPESHQQKLRIVDSSSCTHQVHMFYNKNIQDI